DLDDLPAVTNNLTRLGELLQDPAVWGLPADRCVTVPEPATPAEVLDAVHGAARRAEDTLLVYYAGHGLAHPDVNGLLLTLPGTDPERPYTALDFDAVRREVLGTGRNVNRVVILDCCYSGRAFEGGMSDGRAQVQMAEQARIAGSYLLTASAATRQAQAPPGETYTAFTGELIRLMEGGLPGGDQLIEVSRIYEHLYAELQAKRRPLPQQRLSNTGRSLAFTRNRYGTREAVERVAARAVKERGPTAEAAGEWWQPILRGRPRDIVAEALRLRAEDPDKCAELLREAGRRRPVQEAATMVWLLAGEETRSVRDVVLRAVADREPQDITSCVEALRALGGAEVQGAASSLMFAVGCRPPQAVVAAVRELKAAGYEDERRSVLTVARGRLETTGHVLDLLGALWSGGLDDEAEEVLRTATTRSPAETVVLADALLTLGRPEHAFALYLTHAPTVAGRPAAELTRVLQAMTEAGEDDKARELLRAAVEAEPPSAVADLCASLSSVGMDSWALEAVGLAAGTALDTGAREDELAATAPAAVDGLLALADELRERGRDEAVLQLLRSAAALCPVPQLARLVDALREMGRPVDANRLLAEAAGRGDGARLWDWFLAAGREWDGQLVEQALGSSYQQDGGLLLVSELCARRQRQSPPVPPDPRDDSVLMRVLDGLANRGDSLLDVLDMARRTDQPVVMVAYLASVVRQAPDRAEGSLYRIEKLRGLAGETAVLRALLRDAGRPLVRDVNHSEVRSVLGRVSTRPDDGAYAVAALCAAGREREAVGALLAVPEAVLDQAVLPLVRFL
ncbi:MAG TPA: caspase family protein, partial [Streptomyces sp.]